MKKTILITGATAGIGKQTAAALASLGHQVLLHGRSASKLREVARELGRDAETYEADLADLDAVEALAEAVKKRHTQLDVLINNAGVFKTPAPITPGGRDVRFVVNTLAPYLLTQRLLPLLSAGRVVNLSSAAQNTVSMEALAGRARLGDFEAYAQSKLALTMWSSHLGRKLRPPEPVVVSVNPGSLLGTEMVREGFGVAGNDVGIGVDILVRAALADEFANARGAYYDNDAGRFAPPHPDATSDAQCAAVTTAVAKLALGATSASKSSCPRNGKPSSTT